MKIEQTQNDSITLITVKGGIELKKSGVMFFAALKELLCKDTGSVLVDLSHVNEADSTGLGELVGYLQKFAKVGRRLAILNPSPKIARLFNFTNLNKVFPIYSDRDEALSALKRHDSNSSNRAGPNRCASV